MKYIDRTGRDEGIRGMQSGARNLRKKRLPQTYTNRSQHLNKCIYIYVLLLVSSTAKEIIKDCLNSFSRGWVPTQILASIQNERLHTHVIYWCHHHTFYSGLQPEQFRNWAQSCADTIRKPNGAIHYHNHHSRMRQHVMGVIRDQSVSWSERVFSFPLIITASEL